MSTSLLLVVSMFLFKKGSGREAASECYRLGGRVSIGATERLRHMESSAFENPAGRIIIFFYSRERGVEGG